MASEETEVDARRIKGVVEEAENNMKRDEVYLPGGPGKNGEGKAAQNVFPAKYFARKDDEKKVRLLQEYTAALNTQGRLPTIYAPTESDMNVLMRKDAEKELMNFEGFLQNYFDVDNPIHQKLLYDLYPRYFERRWDVVKEKLQIQEKIAKLKLMGPQTTEDMMFMYALHNGDIEIPSSVVFDTKQDTAANETRFKRGFFNIHHWTSKPQYAGRVGENPFWSANGVAASVEPTDASVSNLLTFAANRKNAGQENTRGVAAQFGSVFGKSD